MTFQRGLLALAVLLALPSGAQAGGYDTPMLYSARHMGMGGTAIGFVDDPSAMFHNPAGLARIDNISLLGDFSLLVGTIQGSPLMPDQSIDSNTTIAPFFLVGGGFRVTDWLVLGVGIYPVASAGASYEYGNVSEDTTKLIFIEASPGFAVNIDAARLTLGAGYRLTYASLTRTRTFSDNPAPFFDFSMTGFNFLGFRAGAQWKAIEDHLSIGLVYRHKTVTELTNDEGFIPTVFTADGSGRATDIHTELTLPSRIGFGVRGDYEHFGAAVDFEYAFNSQNHRSVLGGVVPGGAGTPAPLEAPNVFDWDDAMTLRVGLEYEHLLGTDGTAIRPRLGYVFDARTSTKPYPTAFGTPPAPTHVLTAGAGYDGGPWEVNVAYAYRLGSERVTAADVASGDQGPCVFCSQPGEYAIALNGFYVDFSYDIE